MWRIYETATCMTTGTSSAPSTNNVGESSEGKRLLPLVSVVVPVLSEERYLPKLLYSLDQQTFRNFEVVVVDDGSTDKTIQICREWGTRIIAGERAGEYAARNLGALSSTGEILVFTGADAILPQTMLEHAVRIFRQDKSVVATYCPTVPIGAPSWGRLEFAVFWRVLQLLFYVFRQANASAAFFAVKRSVFLKSGGFESDFAGDSSLSRKLPKYGKVRPFFDQRVMVSARRLTREGIIGFNRHQVTLLFILFPILMRTKIYRRLVRTAYYLHTRSLGGDFM